MRKRISCRIIKSVPLDAGDVRLCRGFSTASHQSKINNGASTYTHRAVVATTCIDEDSPAQSLDCLA